MCHTVIKSISNYPLLSYILAILLILFTGLISYWIIKKIILTIVERMSKRTNTQIDDILFEQKLFHRIALLVAFIIIYNISCLFPEENIVLHRIISACMVWIVILISNALLGSIESIYHQTKFASRFHIKSYIQIIRLVIIILGLIVGISILLGKSPMLFISGIGALTAVLMLVFRDTILSFIASLQINSNDLVRVGDWIEVPTFGADGDVIDIALHTVKVQNWDKTISVIPTYKLIDSTFKNWRGMSETGGRRIKRAVYIDMTSIRFCNEELLDRFNQYCLIKDYLKNKTEEIIQYNKTNKINTSEVINGRRLTNLGTFRAYVEAYLRNHPQIHPDMTFLIRQSAPTEHGLPLEIYVFTNSTEWVKYESIQADIFDHILAVIPEFGLRVFQEPTGADFQKVNVKDW